MLTFGIEERSVCSEYRGWFGVKLLRFLLLNKTSSSHSWHLAALWEGSVSLQNAVVLLSTVWFRLLMFPYR